MITLETCKRFTATVYERRSGEGARCLTLNLYVKRIVFEMKMMFQICTVFTICFIGELISSALPFPVPGTVLSMIFLFLLLYFKFLKVDQMKESADFFLKNMSFFFIPASIELLESYSQVADSVWILIAIAVITAVLTYVVTIYTVAGVMKLQNYISKKKGQKI